VNGLRTTAALASAAVAVSVDFSVAGAAPTYHASGTLYGMTENGSLPQDHFYKDLKWRFGRAGGAQLPGGGCVGAVDRFP
jgi:hypothetical protein